MQNLLNAQSDLSKSFEEGIKLVGGQADAQRKYNETVAKVKSVTRTSRMQREFMALGDVANIQDIQGGEAATARAGLEGALKAANFSDIRSKALIAQFELLSGAGQVDPSKIAEGILEQEQKRLLSTEQIIQTGSGETFGGFQTTKVKREVTEQDRQSAAILRTFEATFEKFLKESKVLQQQPAQAPQQAPQAAQAGNIDLLQAMTTLTEAIRQTAIKNGVPLVPERTPPRKLAAEKLNRGK